MNLLFQISYTIFKNYCKLSPNKQLLHTVVLKKLLTRVLVKNGFQTGIHRVNYRNNIHFSPVCPAMKQNYE